MPNILCHDALISPSRLRSRGSESSGIIVCLLVSFQAEEFLREEIGIRKKSMAR